MFDTVLSHYQDYQRIVLIAQHTQTKKYWHLFSVIELLTKDYGGDRLSSLEWHKSGEHYMIRGPIAKNSDYCFYLAKEVGETSTIIADFFAPTAQNILANETIDLLNQDFILEPNGDNPLVLPDNTYEKDGLGSIIPKHKCGCMVWAQIDANREVQREFLQDNYRDALSTLTNKCLGFDISLCPEHLGNIYLVCPNPYIRDIDSWLSQNPRGIYYQLFRRQGDKTDLRLRITDRHQNRSFVVFEKDFPLETDMGFIALPSEPHNIEMKIIDPFDNVVYISGPVAYVKSISMGISIGGQELHVNDVLDGQKKETVIEKVSRQERTIFGDRNRVNVEEFFASHQKEREYIEDTKNRTFIFFPGKSADNTSEDQRNKAKNVIREIMNKAENSCYLCDPYFGKVSRDILDFAYQIRSTGVKVRILNCKEYVSKDEARIMHENIQKYNEKYPTGPIECRLLRGNGKLHDRFIVSDNNIWFLGSSFNEFGNRATCIGRIPSSSGTEIIRKIEEWYADEQMSESLESYIDKK
jgi:hypothetical protein